MLPQEERIATSRGGCPAPRNDMQKTEALVRVQGRFPSEKAVPGTRLRRCQCMPSFMDITVRPTVPKIFRFLGLTNKNPLL